MGIAAKHLGKNEGSNQMDLYKRYIVDPRPDLQEDHHLWKQLLANTFNKDPYLTHILHGLRCGGTRIKKVKSYYVLRPDIDPTGNLAWEKLEDYEEMRDQYLKPHLHVVVELMKKLTKEVA